MYAFLPMFVRFISVFYSTIYQQNVNKGSPVLCARVNRSDKSNRKLLQKGLDNHFGFRIFVDEFSRVKLL